MKRISAVDEAHAFVRDIIEPGDLAVDATAGRGHDTALLCRLVGARGRVVAIDLQQTALDATKRRLSAARVEDRCDLVLDDHARLRQILDSLTPNRSPSVVMFNLGYLPGSDKAVRTKPASTTRALQTAVDSIGPSGGVSIVVYRGHEGAVDEAAAVERWLAGLESRRDADRTFEIEVLGRDGYPDHRPYVALVRRMS